MKQLDTGVIRIRTNGKVSWGCEEFGTSQWLTQVFLENDS